MQNHYSIKKKFYIPELTYQTLRDQIKQIIIIEPKVEECFNNLIRGFYKTETKFNVDDFIDNIDEERYLDKLEKIYHIDHMVGFKDGIFEFIEVEFGEDLIKFIFEDDFVILQINTDFKELRVNELIKDNWIIFDSSNANIIHCYQTYDGKYFKIESNDNLNDLYNNPFIYIILINDCKLVIEKMNEFGMTLPLLSEDRENIFKLIVG